MKIKGHKLFVGFIAIQIALVLGIGRIHAASGDLDLTFGSGGKVGIFANNLPSSVRIQPDGKIMTIGSYIYGELSFISRNNDDGTPDITFGNNGLVLVDYYEGLEFLNDFVTLSDGKFLVVGEKNSTYALFRYNFNGTRDTSLERAGL